MGPGKHHRGQRQEISRLPFWIVLWAAVFIIGVPLGLIVALHLPSAQKAVIERLVGLIERETSLDIQVEGYRWWPFSRLALLNFQIRSEGRDFLRCEEAQLSYRLSLHRPYVVPLELRLHKPLITLQRDESGRLQLPRIPPGRTSGDPSSDGGFAVLAGILPVLSVRVESGTILGEQDGQSFLTIREMTGKVTLEAVQGPEGPRVRVDLGQWQGVLVVPQWGDWRIRGNVEWEGETLHVPSLTLEVGTKTRLDLKGTLGLGAPHPTVLTLDLAPLSPASFPGLLEGMPQVDEVAGRIEVKGDSRAMCVRHELSSSWGSWDGRAELDPMALQKNGIRWEMRFADFGPPGTGPESPFKLSGFADLSAAGEGLDSLRAHLEARLDSSQVLDHSIRRADLEASLHQGKLELKVSKVQSSLADFSLTAAVDLRGLWMGSHSGEAVLDIEVERAALENMPPGAFQQAGGTVHGEARYAPGGLLRWESWQGKWNANIAMPGLLTLKSSGDWKERLLDLRYELEAAEVQKFSQLYSAWEGKGRLASRGTVTGWWPDLLWQGSLSSPRLEYGPVQVEQMALEGRTLLTAQKDARREVKARAQNVVVQGSRLGAVSLELDQREDECAFQVRLERLLNQIQTRLSGKLESLWNSPRTLTVNQGQISWKDRSYALECKLEIGDDRLKVHGLSVQEGRQKIRLDGDLAWNGQSDLRAVLEDVSIGSWLSVMGMKEVVTGSLGGQIRITGPAEQPQGTLSLSMDNAVLLVNALSGDGTSKQQSPAAGEPSKPESGKSAGKTKESKSALLREPFDRIQLQGSLGSDGARFQGEIRSQAMEAPVVFSAKVPVLLAFKPFRAELRQTEELAASFKVIGLNVERLLPYLRFLSKAGGKMDLEGTVGGTLARPVVHVDGLWREGLFQVKDWPHPIENIRAEWGADARNLIIRKAVVQHLGGTVDLTGRVNYPEFDDLEFDASGRDLTLPEFLGINGKGSCQARLVQSPQEALLTAKAQLVNASMNLGEFETDLARSIEIVGGDSRGDLLEVGGDEKKGKSYYSRLKMGLDVALPQAGTWVRGKGLEAEITGALRLEKTLNSPLRLHGGLQTLRGTYTFQTQKLKISEGELVFSGSPDPDPNLKITCQREIKDVTVQANVTGPLSQPRLRLSSIPAMNQVDVLSYLLFGHPAGDLNTKQSAQLQDGAASWLGSETSRVLKGVLGDTPLTPDTLGYKKGADKGEGGVIEIGKYVTPDLFVTYEKGLRGEKENQVQVEYRLNRNLSIQTQIGGGADQSGVDVFWRYDFGK